MRLIGSLENEKLAEQFSSFLQKEGIPNSYEPFKEPGAPQVHYRIWIQDEEDLDAAIQWLDYFRQNPDDERITSHVIPVSVSFPHPNEKKEEIEMKKERRGFALTLSNFILVLCVFLFIWNSTEEMKVVKEKGALALQIGLTPLQQELLFDYPYAFQVLEKSLEAYPLKSFKDLNELPPEAQEMFLKADAIPSWKGIFDVMLHWDSQGWKYLKTVPMFEKIKQGEVWRFFTPCLLHRDFLHILFNMAWLWILGKQIEDRLKKWKMVLLILIIGIVSNVVQYLISGPYFLGFSGVVVGMVGFIWMRQKKAPWEGYPLQKGIIVFMVVFVGSMFILEIFSLTLQLFSVTNLSANIANTAHIVGGLVGMLLGRFHFFARGIA
jgi:GlpG protein